MQHTRKFHHHHADLTSEMPWICDLCCRSLQGGRFDATDGLLSAIYTKAWGSDRYRRSYNLPGDQIDIDDLTTFLVAYVTNDTLASIERQHPVLHLPLPARLLLAELCFPNLHRHPTRGNILSLAHAATLS